MLDMPPHKKEWISWLCVLLWSLVIYATVPFTRTISSVVRDHWGRELFTAFVLSVIILSAGALVLLLYRSGRAKRENYLWLILTALLGIYAAIGRRASPEESLHFVEYGVLGVLLFRAFSHRVHDPGIYVMAILSGAMIGLGDEVVQWLTPRRFFDFRDVWMNVFGIGLAQLAIAKGIVPSFIRRPVTSASVRRVCVLGTALLLFVGLCLSNTPVWTDRLVSVFPRLDYLRFKSSGMSEFGYRHVIPGMGIFYSRFTLDELTTMDRRRADEAAAILDAYMDPDKYVECIHIYTPVTDPFVHEARVHLYRRDHYRAVMPKHYNNRKMYALHATVAYRENEFMERFFSNTLATTHGYKMIPGHVALLREHLLPSEYVYESAVSRGLITRITLLQAWFVILLGVFLLGLIYIRAGREPRTEDYS